jgi:iron complex outermembrane recepter protein
VFAGAFSGLLGGEPGELRFNFDLFHVDTQQTSVTGLGFDLNRDEGEIGNSEWQWKLETSYERGPLTVIWTVNYMNEAVFNNDFTIETRYPLEVDEYFVHDLAFVYKLDNMAERLGVGLSAATARFVVSNVGDVEPPFGTTGLGVYDVIGRYYRFGLTARF